MTSKILSDSAQYKLPFKFNPTGFKQEMNMSGSKSVIEVSDGYLVGFDHGEFGGGLYWFSKNGSQTYQISDFHVKQFSKAKDKIYAIAGIEHMGSDMGNLMSISLLNDKWMVNNSVKLPNDPKAIGIDSADNIVIVTSSAVLSVGKMDKIIVLNTYPKWKPIIFQSVLIIKNNIAYIGMDQGIYKLDLISRTAEWLLQN